MTMTNDAPLFWISAGELSGDMHAAELAEALAARRPKTRFTGMGGPHLRAMENFVPLFGVEELSVMGLGEVLTQLPRIVKLLGRIKGAMAETRPDALICVDAPSFNFRVIKTARALGIPVYYYISPKIWAWKEKRAYFLKKNVRRLISILPFEVDFYKKFDMTVDYVGSPLVDMMNLPRLDAVSPEQGLIGVLPGSRGKEISSLMPEFGKAARIMREAMPDLRFACAAAPGLDENRLRSLWPIDVPLELVSPENRYAFMRRCEMLLAASGTVTLEAALAGTPTLVAYKVSPLTWAVARMLVKVPYISLSNLILGRDIFPELLQKESDGANLAKRALAWLSPGKDGARPLDQVRRDLVPLRGMMKKAGAVGESGSQPGPEPGRTAAGLAASVILEDMQSHLSR